MDLPETNEGTEPSGPGSRSVKPDRVRLLRTIANLYAKGCTPQEIGNKLNLSLKMVKRSIGKAAEECTEFLQGQVERELLKIDALEFEYWGAWEQSKLDARSETEKFNTRAREDASSRVETQLRTESQTGDPRFLQGIERCMEMRKEYIQSSSKASGRNWNPDLKIDLHKATPEMLAAISDLIHGGTGDDE